MPFSLMRRDGDVVVVRERDGKVLGRHKDRKKALRQLRVLFSLEKASFGGDRSAAGRYAAEQRWKNHKKKEEDKKGRGDRSPLAQSIIEANESLAKAGCTVRTIEITKRDSELSQRLRDSLRKSYRKVVQKIAELDEETPEENPLWVESAHNLMDKSIYFDDTEYNYRNPDPVGQFIILVEKNNLIVGAMRYKPDNLKEEFKDKEAGEISYAGSFRVAKGIGTAMFGEALKIAAKTGTGAIKIEALDTAKGFWESQGFRRLKGAELKENSTYDMTIDADTVQALAKEISS
jgi:GNAT superfamily N-acetyltransferase